MFRETGLEQGTANAAKLPEQAAIPQQHVKMPARQGRQDSNHACFLQRGNAMAHCMTGEAEPPPCC